MTPKDPYIAELWKKRRELLNKAHEYSLAISALQNLCEHPNDVDVSRHGSPDMECPDCGRGMLP